MCGCVPGEVLRQCSAANPADIYVPSVRSLQRSFRYEVYLLLPFPNRPGGVIA